MSSLDDSAPSIDFAPCVILVRAVTQVIRRVWAATKIVKGEAERRRFVLQVVQPGLAGLMDGSVSTLAPVFAAACATHHTREAFIVGMAASIGAGISMGLAEALSDDGVLSGRGNP